MMMARFLLDSGAAVCVANRRGNAPSLLDDECEGSVFAGGGYADARESLRLVHSADASAVRSVAGAPRLSPFFTVKQGMLLAATTATTAQANVAQEAGGGSVGVGGRLGGQRLRGLRLRTVAGTCTIAGVMEDDVDELRAAAKRALVGIAAAAGLSGEDTAAFIGDIDFVKKRRAGGGRSSRSSRSSSDGGDGGGGRYVMKWAVEHDDEDPKKSAKLERLLQEAMHPPRRHAHDEDDDEDDVTPAAPSSAGCKRQPSS